MRGYLSRIAKQSGVRYSKPGSRIEDPFVPEVEKTVMVRPNFAETKVVVTREPQSAQRTQPEPKPERADNAAKHQENGMRDHATRSSTRQEAQDQSSVRHGVARAIENAGNTTRFAHPDVLIDQRVSGTPRVVEQTDFRVLDPSEGAGDDIPPTELAQRSGLETRASNSAAGHVSEPKEYFARTAEILSNRDSATTDLQTIVLQEVQEWVAASPVDPPVAQADPQMRDAAPVVKDAKAHAPGLMVIRESEPRDRLDRALPIEQKFELSIGTIDVIIEESEGARLPEPPARQPIKAAREEESRFSRLSRSYL